MDSYKYCLLLSLMFLITSLYYIKKRVLEFKYSILWILTSAAMIVLSLNKSMTEFLAGAVRIYYPPAFLFVTGIVFTFLLIFYVTLIVSDMQRKLTRLTQEVGILTTHKGKGEEQ